MGADEYRPILGKKEKIFLTGHTGFKGTWMTLLLESMGHEVIGYSLRAQADSLYERIGRQGLINETFADIRNRDLLTKTIQNSKPSIVIHMAAQPLVIEAYKNPLETFEINALGTANVMETSFKLDTIKTIGVITTDKVYKNNESNRSFVEDDPLEGSSDPYSASKVATEAVISGWKRIATFGGGPAISTLRSGNVIGGGDYSENRLIPDLVRSYISKNPTEIRNPKSTRPWMHVLDSLVGYLLAINLANENNKHNVYNFAPSDKSISVEEVLNYSLQIWPEMFRFITPRTNSAFHEANSLNLNPQKAINELNWKANWSQKEAVESTIEWWRNLLQEKVSPLELCNHEIKDVLRNA